MDHPEHGETPAQHPGAENDQDPGRPRSGSTGRSKKRGLFSRLRHPSAPRNPVCYHCMLTLLASETDSVIFPIVLSLPFAQRRLLPTNLAAKQTAFTRQLRPRLVELKLVKRNSVLQPRSHPLHLRVEV